MHRYRLALILVPLLMSAALIATLVTTYMAVRGGLDTLVLGQGDAILDALAHHPGERLESEFLGTMLDEQAPEGLRCVAVFDRAMEPRAVAGDCLAEGADELRAALLGVQSHEVLEVGDRVRMTRGLPRDGALAPGDSLPRDAVMVEFEPLMRRELEHGALRSLGIGGIASLALVAVAVGLWRFSLREERLKAAMERDRRLASLGEMAAVLAHEIRNPLTSMKGHAQLLAERLDAGSPERGKADRVVGEAVRLEQLTADLLSFIRSENIERRSADPRAVAEAAADDVGRERVEIDASGAPAEWSLDPRLMQQALANLLRNALQATPNGEPATVAVSREEGRLVFAVRDRGEGLDEADREKIFEPFYTTRVRGTGLGLPVARRIVILHRGAIEAITHPEGGAVFRVTIPSG
jgi:two-component system, NtrC family, sensor histidine kinase HydH